MPRTLHLIKHGQPTLVPDVPAHEWHLAPDALDGLPDLLARLDPRPDFVVCSEEPKAKATAQALAAALGVPCRPMLGLHEHLRYGNELVSADEFQNRFRRFFAEPGQVVVGEESADDAWRRFANAITAVLKVNPQPTRSPSSRTGPSSACWRRGQMAWTPSRCGKACGAWTC